MNGRQPACRCVATLGLAAAVLLVGPVPAAPQGPTLERAAGSAPAIGERGQPYTIASRILGESREILIATPSSYDLTDPDRRYPVILILDGGHNFAPTVAAAHYLAAAGQIPEALVVGIPNTNRLRDLTPPGLSVSGSGPDMGGDRFLDFIQRELIPALEREHRAGAPRVLLGHSSGGVLVTWAAASRPEAFPLVVAMDAPVHLQDRWLADRLTESTHRSAPLRYVSIEVSFGWPDTAWAALQAAAPGSWTLTRERLEHESHQSMVLLATYLGLRAVFSDYSTLAAPSAPASATLDHYADLPPEYGGDVVPPRPLLDRLVEDLVIEGRVQQAAEILDRLESGYGVTQATRGLRDRVAAAEDQPPLEATVASLLAEPRPAVAEMAGLLGTWRGHMWTEGSGTRSPIVVRFEGRDGRVEGEFVQRPGTPAEDVQPLEHIRRVEGGIHFGYMNRMRPRGVLMYEAVVTHGHMEGRMHLRGVRFTPPGGRALPTVRFALDRAGAGSGS